MSVCNISFSTDRITILSDTLIYNADSKPTGLSEGKTGTNGRFAWNCRGSMAFCHPVAVVLSGDPERTLDQAVDGIRYFMANNPVMPKGQEITLAGWSDTADRLRVVRLMRRCDADPVTETDIEPGIHLMPAPRIVGVVLPDHATDEQMIKLALMQYRVQEKFDFKCCVGGLMHMTEVNRGGVTQKVVGRYPDYDLQYSRFIPGALISGEKFSEIDRGMTA